MEDLCMRAQMHTFILMEEMNKRGQKLQSTGGARSRKRRRESGGELGGRGQREIGGERIRL